MIRSRLVPKESTYAFKEFGVRELAVSIKNQGQDFPGNPMVKTPSFCCRGEGSIPGKGTKIPHAEKGGQKVKKKSTIK